MSVVVVSIGSLWAATTGSARASCSSPVFFGSYSHYVFTPDVCPGAPCPGGSSVGDGFAGSFWALGFGDPRIGHGIDNGLWPARENTDPGTGWIRSYSGQPAYLSGWWGNDPRSDACIIPNECMAVLLSDKVIHRSFFALLTKRGDASEGFTFESDVVLEPIPKPRVAGSSRNGNVVEMTIVMDPPVSGTALDPMCPQGVLLGYKIYGQLHLFGPSPTDLHRSLWTVAAGGEGAGHPTVYPGAPQICDRKNNDCLHASWPGLVGTNEDGVDGDVDTWAGSCDNCPIDANPSQSDRNADGVGDSCDLGDGLILLGFADPGLVRRQHEAGFDTWNLYRAGLDVLRASGVYTQAPGSNPIARRDCGLAVPSLSDSDAPASGKVALYLGTTSSGATRPNTTPCP